MKWMAGIGLAVALFVSMAAGAAGQEAARPLKVLLIDGQNNHRWQETSPIMRAALEACGRFAVTVSTAPGRKAKPADWDAWRPDFAKFDVVLSNYNGKLWPKPVCDAFEKYMKEGGGLVLLHAADNAFPRWEAWNRMIGLGGWGGRNEKSGPYVYWKDGKFVRDTSKGRGGGHGRQYEFAVDIRDTEHPITRGVPKRWKHAREELYDSLRGPAEKMTVLSTALSNRTKRHEPVEMVIAYGKGRVYHNVLGHGAHAMRCAGFLAMLQRGTEWAATGAVTLPLPKNFPGPDKVVPLDPTKPGK